MTQNKDQTMSGDELIRMLLAVDEEGSRDIRNSDDSYDSLFQTHLGKESEFSQLASSIRFVSKEDKSRVGTVMNSVKKHLMDALSLKHKNFIENNEKESIDVTAPGQRPLEGHLHIVTQAIEEITATFNKLGFTRVRHPEVDWDYYAFEALNMPKNHPARDEWETFFIQNPTDDGKQKNTDSRFDKMVLTPHTSNGQIHEMEKGVLPIRMINIAKCYRRQIDVSHTPMFHQFEGLYIDKNVSIGHLKGVLDYFAASFFGKERKTRIRPFHFQFTEPSFEVDISCGICNGKGCRLCKEGWLELGGSGMVHPNVLRFCNIDPDVYNGYAFGWGVERAYMMKSQTNLDDIRILYGNDIRFLTQF